MSVNNKNVYGSSRKCKNKLYVFTVTVVPLRLGLFVNFLQLRVQAFASLQGSAKCHSLGVDLGVLLTPAEELKLRLTESLNHECKGWALGFAWVPVVYEQLREHAPGIHAWTHDRYNTPVPRTCNSLTSIVSLACRAPLDNRGVEVGGTHCLPASWP